MRLPLVLLLCFFLPRLAAQQLIFENLNKLNLPSQECYNVMQDSKGYIWIGTEGGLCRYNGNSVKVFNKKNGLSENACYVVKEDAHGRVWIITSAARILYYRNDSIREFPFTKKFVQQLNTTEWCYKLDFKKDSFFINTKSFIFTGSARSLTLKRGGVASLTNHFTFQKTGDQLIYLPDSIQDSTWLKNIIAQTLKSYAEIHIVSGKKSIIFNAPCLKNKTYPWRVFTTVNKKGESFIAYDNTLIKVYADLQYEIYQLPSPVLCLYTDSSDGLWAGILKNGFCYYPDVANMQDRITGLEDYSITGICEDHEKGIWCTSLEKGVFYSRSKWVTSYVNIPGLGQKAGLLKTIHDTVYTTSNRDNLYMLHDSRVIQNKLFHKDNFYAFRDIIPYKGGFLVATGDQTVFTDRNFKMRYHLKRTVFHIGTKGLLEDAHGKVYTLSSQELWSVKEKKVRLVLKFKAATQCFYSPQNSNLLYVGGEEGAFSLLPEDTNTVKKLKGIPSGVVKIIEDHEHHLWFLTSESGLYKMNGKTVVEPVTRIKLQATFFFDLAEDRFHNFWLAANTGVIKVWQEKNRWKTRLYNAFSGLASNQTYKVTVDSSYLYVSTAEGINRFPLGQDLSDISKPSIYLRQVEVNNKPLVNSASLTLEYNNNSLRLLFDVLTFKTEKPSLVYVLKNGTTHYYHSSGYEINLNNLLPGTYELAVYAANNNTLLNTVPFTMYFTIRPAFWQSPWFLVLSALLLLALLIFAVKKIIQRVKRKEREKADLNVAMAEYQLTALQAQMNPHFIFNVINSIQTYILDNEVQVAYDYLARFSKLVRLVLDNARDKMISLDKELEVLDIYIQLEQLRFGNRFTYQLHLDKDMDRDAITLPPMLLQPFVENAIWHGLMPLEKSKQAVLSIRMQLRPGNIEMSVEDNGVGRERSAAIKKLSSHKSAGLALTHQRMKVLDSLPGYSGVHIHITDLYDADQNACGTRVNIILPLNSSNNDY